MNINIENTSSPGASFTDNTDDVILKTYEFTKDNPNEIMPFIDFRKRLESEKKINDNNNRNVYPLLKNCGFVEYEKGCNIKVGSFFTKKGNAYIKALESYILISNDNEIANKTEALKILNLIKQDMIFDALCTLVERNDVNYISPFQCMINYLLHFSKIDRNEFAILLDLIQNHKSNYSLSSIENTINDYRNHKIEVKVTVNVRNDKEIRSATNMSERKEDIRYLTSYSYFTSLLIQSGLIEKTGKYYIISKGKDNKLKKIGGIIYE